MKRKKVETVIVGGGCMGLFTGYFLNQLGYKDFIILEQDYVGSGSTGRCGSGIRAQFATESNIQLMKKSIKLWKELSQELDVSFTQKGYLYLTYKESELETFKKMVKLQNSLGVGTKIISPREIRDVCGYIDTSKVLAGSYNPEDGKADPLAVVFNLAKSLSDSGNFIVPHSQVKDIKTFRGNIDFIQTDEGRIFTSRLVNAAGGWASQIGDMLGLKIPIKPFRHQAVITEPIEDGSVGPMIVSLTHDDAYFTQSEDGGIIGGVGLSEEETSTFRTRETIEFEIRVSQAFTQIMPSLKDLRMLRNWGGYYAMTPDGNPMIGEFSVNGHYIVSGFSGHGFMMAPMAGKSMAELIVKGKSEIDLDYYDPTRFERGELREADLQMG